MVTLKNQIFLSRAKKGWTQQQLADSVGVSRQTIIALEKNKYNPSLILAFKIAAVLDEELPALFTYEEE
ncbi:MULTISPECIES: helix-turn-helix transcriptional regulator [unclassified Exiguobacterium]|uniref:Transcriptional regulator, XRE family n=1 Tax=Exiguobacterium sp. (strain ATCC BAA-1283 / AT1b) TaxID=360911 RepID=C4L5F6_EXISA|nr:MULTISPECIES: helix-turn-helix transcriptional regulator [unclassified Exiguobacterium]ACQ69771.1 transcriptional regulator, XRE family [Exiguobacterium sp. AT1b]MDT0192137.1 helix-turn-helix transcriptional regulator [Exiguobacterium sp. BG5(2022)]